jgi:hypothetical protein
VRTRPGLFRVSIALWCSFILCDTVGLVVRWSWPHDNTGRACNSYTVPNAQKINHVARISAHRTESPTCPRGGFPAFPQTKPEVGRLSRQFLYYLEVISKACSRFSVGRMGCGTTRRGQRLCNRLLLSSYGRHKYGLLQESLSESGGN